MKTRIKPEDFVSSGTYDYCRLLEESVNNMDQLRVIDLTYCHPTQSEDYKMAATHYNNAVRDLKIAMFKETIERLIYAQGKIKEIESSNISVYYSISDSIDIALDHLETLKKGI